MRKLYATPVLFLLVILFQACEVEEIPGPDDQEILQLEPMASAYSADAVDWKVYFFKESDEAINGYEVNLLEVTKEIVDEIVISTTFTYLVSGVGETAQMDSFFIEIPVCAGDVLSWSPLQSAKLEDGRLKWNSSVSKDGAQEFSITFAGDLNYGVIDAIVVRASEEFSKKVLGPCAGAYDLTGYVYIDANESRSKEASEFGIKEYTVVLEQDGRTAQDITDEDGFYSFRVLPGPYKLSVKTNILGDPYYSANDVKPQEIEVSKDSEVNFGYQAIASKMIEDFTDGDIQLNTLSAKVWGQQLKLIGKRGAAFSEGEVLAWLSEIEGPLLQDNFPFNFGGNKIGAALEILSKPIRTDQDLFLQQLLAAELNYVSGRGAYDIVDGELILRENFNLALIKYAEAKALGDSGATAGDLSTMAISTARIISSPDSGLLTSFNENGSGGL